MKSTAELPVMETYKFFNVRRAPKVSSRKTHDYLLVNNTSGATIGSIQWYGSWRQFCFFPSPETVWSIGCLAEVRAFLHALKTNRAKYEK